MKPHYLHKNQRGFTIIEIVCVLFIMGLVFAAALPVTGGLIARQRLNAPVRKIQLFAKTARSRAIQEGVPYEIKFTPTGFFLRPFHPPDPKVPEDLEEEAKQAPFSYVLSDDVVLSIRRWGNPQYDNGEGYSWQFSRNGLCQPIIVRFTREPSYVEHEYNPLTANPQNEAYYFP